MNTGENLLYKIIEFDSLSFDVPRGVFALAQKRKNRRQSGKLHLPVPEVLSSDPHIELLGNHEIVVDGCKGVVEYDENIIRLNTGELVVGFMGTDLLIKSFDCDIAVITGRVAEITFTN